MASTAGTARQYFLGVGGEQLGPFTEDQVAERIRQGLVPNDALIWYEGLTDWAPVTSIEYFKPPFAELAKTGARATTTPAAPPAESVPAPVKKVAAFNPEPSSAPVTEKIKRVTSAAAPRPTKEPFSRKLDIAEDPFGTAFAPDRFDTAWASSRQKVFVGLGVVLVVALGIFFLADFMASGPPPAAESAASVAAAALSARTLALNKAQSELLLSPEISVPALRKLINEKGDDAVGKEALASLTNYYKQKGLGVEAAHLFMALKRPDEAVPFLVDQPGFAKEAEAALFAAYQMATDPAQKRDYLIRDIRQLLVPLADRPHALERIQLLQTEFPQLPNPYRYYLEPTSQKVVELFGRLSPVFVQGLLSFLEMEFPDLKTVKRPLVELKKDPQGRFRIVGSYLGEVVLRMDSLKGITFTFWLSDEQWYVVGTNLTPERKKYAGEVKERFKDKVSTPDDMLAYLEAVFAREYPQSALHESVGAPTSGPTVARPVSPSK